MAETTSREFVEWIDYLNERDQHTDMDRWYMAQIALEVRRSYISDPRSTRLKDFELKFKQQRAEGFDARVSKVKSFWFALCGVEGEE